MFWNRKTNEQTTIVNKSGEPDLPFEAILSKVRSETMTSDKRIVALCDATTYLSRSKILGDIVECGVWRGGSMMAAAHCLMDNQDLDRELWLFDTFSGMSLPTKNDVDYMGNEAGELLQQIPQDSPDSIWCYATIEEVQSNMNSAGYPGDKIHYVQGSVEETLLEHSLPDRIALLRLDTDWYESTRIELEILFPRLVPGGVLIIDDYGHWDGCKKAVDEYFAENNIPILLNRIDYTGRIAIKVTKENFVAT